MKIRNACRLRTALTVASLLAATCAVAATDTRAARFYEDALTRYEKGDAAGAVIQLKNALKTDRSQLPVHVLLGKALLASGDAVGAEVAFDEALRLGVNRAEVVLPLGEALLAQGKPGLLLEQARFNPAGLPTDVRAALLVMRAGAAADTGNPQVALQTLAEARALAPQDPGSWLAEVPLRLRARQFAEAVAAADKAMALAPGRAQGHYLRGTVAHAQQKPQDALDAYERALRAEPAHVETLVSRAGLLIDLGRDADAARDVAALRKTAPLDPRGAYLAALQAEKAGRAAEARAALRDVTGLLDPVPVDFLRYRPQLLMLGGLAHYGLGENEKALPFLEMVQRDQPGSGAAKLVAQIRLSQDNVTGAIEAIEGYLRRHPGDTQAQLLLAGAQMAQGRHARATAIAEDALRRGDSPAMREVLGLSLAAGGKVPDAVDALAAAFKADPSRVAAGTALAQIYLRAGLAPRAVEVATRLVERQPRQPGLQNLLGDARRAAGDAAGAQKAYEQAIALDANYLAPKVQLARLDASAGRFDAAQQRLQAVLAQDDKSVDALLALGQVAERRGRLDEARRWLEKADDHAGPDAVEPALQLVDFHLRHGAPQPAAEALKRATGRAPEALPVLLASARVALAQGDAAAARSTLGRASALAGSEVGALVRVAMLQLQAGHAPGAVHALANAR